MTSKKRISIVAIVLFCALIFALVFCCIIEANPAKKKPLFDKSGAYSQEAFEYNISLSKKGGIVLFNDASTKYTIIYPLAASDSVKKSANLLADAIYRIGGVKPSVFADVKEETDYEICIGNTNRKLPTPTCICGDGFAIKNDHERLFLYANTDLGIRNAVYGMLENQLGCLFAGEKAYYPTLKKAVLDPIDKCFNNRYTYYERTPLYASVSGGDVADIPCLSSGISYADELLGIEGLDCLCDDDIRTALTINTVARMNVFSSDALDISVRPGEPCDCSTSVAFAEQYDSVNAGTIYVVNELAKSFPEVNFSTTLKGDDVCEGLDIADNMYIRIVVDTDAELEEATVWLSVTKNVVIVDNRFADADKATNVAQSLGALRSLPIGEDGICAVTVLSDDLAVQYVANKLAWNFDLTTAQLLAKYNALIK